MPVSFIILRKTALDKCKDMCQAMVEGIRNGTASIVSDGSFNRVSPIGPVGTSVVILAPSTECLPRYWIKGWNRVTGPAASQSTYRSELAGVVVSLTVLYIVVCHHNITERVVKITLDGKIAMKKSSGDWPLSVNQKMF